ncbi:hypothetical protein [Teredinibacter purpureus]|uniref:hypothetical protein n=1 Tax=Teredinibacter purpureus TaxID=2731756 RepID=UPI0005F7E09C|nr:hypothetical protein [Teredinibacter purpureus]
MISILVFLGVAGINEFWFFPAFKIKGKVLKLGLTIAPSAVLLYGLVYFLELPLASLRYGVALEETNDSNLTLPALLILITIGVFLCFVGVLISKKNT